MADVPMNVLVPAASALVGVLIGSITPIVNGWMQARFEHRRERMRLATQLAIEDYRVAMEKAKNGRPGTLVPPLSLFVVYHTLLLERIASGKQLTPEDFADVQSLTEKITADAHTP
jgi:hypothetical protein